MASFFLAICAGVIRIARRLMPGRPVSSATPPVLLLEPFGLGDVITHEPLIRVLQAHACTLTFCARSEWRILFPRVRWVDSELAWGHHARGDKYSISDYFSPAFRKCYRELRLAARGSVGIDTRGDIRSVLLLYLAGCREVITLSNYLGSDLKVPSFVGHIVPFSASLRRWESNVRFAAPIGGEIRTAISPMFPHLKINEERGARRIGLIPMAPWKGKWWEPAKWRSLVAALGAHGFDCTGLCGPGQNVLAGEHLGTEVRIVECDSVEEWSKALQQFACIVTLDTGPMHLADALGVRVVGLFGQGLLPLWAPSRPDSVVISHQSDPDFQICAPIEANTAAGEKFMRRITVEEVVAAVDRLMGIMPPTAGPSP